MRTVASEVTSFSGRRCTRRMKRRIRREVPQTLAKEFVTGLSAAFRDALTWDPRHVGLSEPEVGSLACETDRDCRFAYDGVGLRHRCMVRSRDRYPAPFDSWVRNPGARVCHFVSEPDRINVRPDGIQIAITGEDDAEASTYMSEDAPVAFFCNNRLGLNGAIPPGWDAEAMREILPPPRLHTLTAPFVESSVRPNNVRTAVGTACSAAPGRPTGLLGLLLLAALRRRRRR